MSYQPGVPTGSVPLNQDYLNLQTNFSQINTQFLVDHVPLTSTSGTPPNGYHTAVHLVPVSTTASNPPNNQPINGYTATTGYGQVLNAQINDGINTDEALFFLSGGNRLMQLTRNFVPVAATNGYTFLPGGLILQWGIKTVTASSTTPLLFATNNIAFPTSCFNVSVTGIRANSGGDGIFVLTGSVSNTGFTFRNGSGSIVQAYWMAIGI
jgi:hypothetical protein